MSVLAETPASPKSGGAASPCRGRPDATFTARSWSHCDRAPVKKGKLAGLHRRSGRNGGGTFVIQGGSSAGRLTARRSWFQPARYRAAPATRTAEGSEGSDRAANSDAAQRGRGKRQGDDRAGLTVGLDPRHTGDMGRIIGTILGAILAIWFAVTAAAGIVATLKTFVIIGLIAMAVVVVVWLVARRPGRG
jgi:hypothetical protein